MCLGIPGQVVEWASVDRQLAWVDVCGVKREVNVALIVGDDDQQPLIGSWVLVHVGFAMSRLDEREARDTLDALRQMEEVEQDVTVFLRT
ncbi:HypC/HybG/HupF family hydrogenase formation chaperone [Prodigiosinella confusarubida]|uniref:HypC/HybG/HupF family hydrogenase formation chaperone n=1 Tax=Serratia sp. (strain ATCC 39006) TaxID=104623 RepID=A0A2I5TA02_SERS3|nr:MULTISPECIES: HypC/HybG/HupF family hydrogenase formation chaperone [Enterobacterales]WJV56661.1 HypC/HybG/HupF family hydrogenase formation chaperone [Pectobacteriaceae bacterium C111]WJY13733.1 HypC/HybG/HupF family hydrogenase formation chaperone [Pectobacteriaceae bacterium CE90]AUH01403.1 HypC/HybG/HupF family hydrogenase formation chaperone [Serratia sp. ATCC 39006]AUH05724.1 HypC/HybG/HupF family hydrogenase formation chaperone [Serratia sp. ATCC 39006]WJV52307.1 HypC/HybG/HupF famil